MSWLFGNRSLPKQEDIPIDIDISNQLDELLQDSPETRERVSKLEAELAASTKALKHLIKISQQYQAMGTAFNEICMTFGCALLSFDFTGLPFDSKASNPLHIAAQAVGQTIIDINDYQNMLMHQIQNVFTQPLQSFVANELKKSKEKIKTHYKLQSKYDQAVSRFSHMKKNDLSKISEAEHELMLSRDVYQQDTLTYVSTLGKLTTQTKLQVLERSCAFLCSEKAFFNQGIGIHSKMEKTLANLSRQITSTHDIVELRDRIVETKCDELRDGQNEMREYQQESGRETAGYLFRHFKTGNKWRRGYYEISNGILMAPFLGKDQEPEKIIHLLLTTVKKANLLKRRFCFEIVSPNDRITLQAESEEILLHWIQVIRNATEYQLNNSLPNEKKAGHQSSIHSTSSAFLQSLYEVPENKQCCDCSAPNPTWASINLGVIICITCSGFHRQLGTHISRVRSITLDAWDLELQKLLINTGNRLAIQVFENRTVGKELLKPKLESTEEEKREWILNKYTKWLWLAPIPSNITYEELLISAVKESDLSLTLNLIVRGVNMDWKDPKQLDFSALHFAISEGDATICDLLLQNGANPNIADGSGWTPLHHCAYLNKVDCVILLIRRGANLTIKDNRDKTPLDIAVANVQAHCVTLLRLGMHASDSGNPLEDESFAIALREFSEEVEEMLQDPSHRDGLWIQNDHLASDDEESEE